jgi:sulfate/thiosulfate transport system ATP-binding protein
MSIEMQNISKTFGRFTALKDVTIKAPTGELVALLGPSGSGKTTLLRIIAGLEIPDPGSGPILFHDEDVARRTVRERGIGFVFQHYALFRHMTVFENIAFGLRVRPRKLRPDQKQIRERVYDLLRLIQLESLAGRYPSELSGGQRQRVALARTLAVEPKVLLLDEPFGSLDARVRVELRQWLRRLHDEIHLTSIFVTHDQEEALEVADRIVVLNQGRIEQTGTPDEVFHQPATEFVMQFLGNVNLFRGRVEDGKAHFGPVSVDYGGVSSARQARVFVRPHDFDLSRQSNGHASFKARIVRIHSAGPVVKISLRSEFGEPVEVEMGQDRFANLRPASGEEIFVCPKKIKIFKEDYSI